MVAAVDQLLTNFPAGWGVIKADQLNEELVEKPDLIVIDVRTPGEVEKGVIDAPNVLTIPLDDFIALQDQWPAAKDAEIVTYCKAGHRSTMAMTILLAYGYENVRSLAGGYTAWVSAEYPIVGGEADFKATYGEMIANMKGYYALKDMAALNEMLASDNPPFLLDVRNPAELEDTGHIEGAVNIPLKELAQHIDLLPSFDTPIVTYCKGGWRAAIAMTALHAMGWKDVVAFHSPSYTGWAAEGYPTVEGLAEEPMVLDAAHPDPALVAAIDEMLQNYPDGWGGISPDGLVEALVENPDIIVIDVRTPGEVSLTCKTNGRPIRTLKL